MSANERVNTSFDASRQNDRITFDGPGVEVRSEDGAIIVDITLRRGLNGDETSAVRLDLDPEAVERFVVDLQTGLAELRSSLARESGSESTSVNDDRASDRPRTGGFSYQELGLTREEFDALAESMAHLARYWDRDDMDEYGDLYSR